MANKPDPKLIGAFTAGAILLLVAMVLFFSSNQFFKQRVHMVLMFEQSVQGLSTGSTVKLRGVPIGRVTGITIRIDGQELGSTAIPVLVEIDYQLIIKHLNGLTDDVTVRMVEDWLATKVSARMELESLITGQAYVELTYHPEGTLAKAARIGEYATIPTEVSSIEAITADIAEVIQSLNDIDVSRLNENINVVLENLSVSIQELTVVLEGIDSEGISTAFKEAATTVTAFVESDGFNQTLVAVREAFTEVSVLAQSLNSGEGAMGESMAEIKKEIVSAMSELNRLIASVNELARPDGDFSFEMVKTMRQMSAAAAALQAFAEYIENNPRALLSGRAEKEQE